MGDDQREVDLDTRDNKTGNMTGPRVGRYLGYSDGRQDNSGQNQDQATILKRRAEYRANQQDGVESSRGVEHDHCQ